MAIIGEDNETCVILADRLTPLADRLRELLRESFGAVFTVGDSRSLLGGAKRLQPNVIIVDLSFGEQGTAPLIRQLKAEVPNARIIALTLYEDRAIAEAAMAEGADGVVLKRSIGDDLLPAVDAVLSGESFVSSCFETDRVVAEPAQDLSVRSHSVIDRGN